METKVHEKFQGFPVLTSLFVFVLWLLTAKLGQYTFINLHTSPALIWAPCGIALAAVILYGYRMWIPIACAAFLATLTSPSSPHFLVVLGATIGQTASPVFGAYFLRRIGFSTSFKNSVDILKFFGAAMVISAITPTIIVLSQVMTHTLSDTLFISWSRSWAGRLLGILLMTPLVTTWFPWRKNIFNLKAAAETVLIFAVLFIVTYVTFWTQYAQSMSFVIILAIFGVLFWVAMRLDSRWVALSLFLLTAFGMAGVIFIPRADRPLNQQMFSIELFMILITPIFLAFSALIQERRLSVLRLEDNMRKLEEAMRKLNNEDRSKNEFIAILAHELRNPLAPVLSTLELLKTQDQSPEALKMIESAEGQTHTMKRLLDDLLDVARIVQKEFKLNKKIVDLRSAINNCVYSTESLMSSRGHTLALRVPPKESVYLEIDQVRFEQVIVNLLNNAAKYTVPGGFIELSCVTSKDALEVSVKDNGIGISKEDLNHIFEPFRQARLKSEVGTGLGIGLSLARRLVEMHHGRMRVESDGEGRGSTFTVIFPFSEGLKPPAPDAVPSRQLKTDKPVKVLVVDDNKPAAEGLEKLLKIKGFEIHLAYDGQSAIKMADMCHPHIILLDIGLPDMDGYEVARKLRGNNFSSAIIALSGYGQEEDKLKAKNAGFNHHLTKPVSIDHLERVLHQYV